MSLYGELLRQVVDSEAGWVDRPVPELVALVLARRADVSGDTAGRAPSRLGDALSYDAALVHLCDRLGIEHDLLGPEAGPAARRQTEERLAGRLPALAPTLAGGDLPGV
ncbi:MAG: hypothetical protein J2P57_06890 [Acidimicrobiaceae bacterium]|nr:hypothetical protein [Acidimicrobiaceae bacterium]